MLSFKTPAGPFLYRTVGIVRSGDRVLFEQYEENAFWNLPGGRVEHGETAFQALAREVREELGVDGRPERFLFAVDNHFDHRGERCHELGLYFEVALPRAADGLATRDGPFPNAEGTAVLQWHALSMLADLDVRPAAAKDALMALGESGETHPYLCQVDGETSIPRPR